MLTLAQYAPLLGQAFELQGDAGGTHAAALLEARPLRGQAYNGREPFALLFEGPPEPVLPQCIYRVKHAQGAPQEMFLVPVARTPGGVHYEAVFN